MKICFKYFIQLLHCFIQQEYTYKILYAFNIFILYINETFPFSPFLFELFSLFEITYIDVNTMASQRRSVRCENGVLQILDIGQNIF